MLQKNAIHAFKVYICEEQSNYRCAFHHHTRYRETWAEIGVSLACLSAVNVCCKCNKKLVP
jgi:hypothetical protein